MIRAVLILWAFGFTYSFVWAEAPAVKAVELPRISPTPPKEALKTFEIKPGFRIELVVVAHLSNSAFAFEKTPANISVVSRLVLVL